MITDALKELIVKMGGAASVDEIKAESIEECIELVTEAYQPPASGGNQPAS
nr:MAG TPA: hypothetical protein [Caudoviricetes sp.]